MTREEWYRHTVLDAIIKVQEYTDLIFDESVLTNISKDQALLLSRALTELMRDIDIQIDKGGDS